MGIGWRMVTALMTAAIVVAAVCLFPAVQPEFTGQTIDNRREQTAVRFEQPDRNAVLPDLGQREEQELTVPENPPLKTMAESGERQFTIEEQLARVRSARQEISRDQGSGSRVMKSWPVPAGDYRMTGYFNEKRKDGVHKGIDIAVPLGTPVLAVFPGKALRGFAGDKTSLGRYVYIEHSNEITTYYGHLSDWALPAEGMQVSAGTVIGWSGNTGNSTGPHLHFEIRKEADRYVNPLEILSYSEGFSQGD